MALSFTDENSLFNFVVKEGNGVKGLVDSGLTEVPRRFIQPPDERLDKQHAAPSSENMIIDLSELDGPNHDEVVKAISHAAETLGFFQVVNHGVPLELLDSLETATHKFFDQPAEKKATYLKEVSDDPMIMYATSFIPEKEKVWMWRDFFKMTYTNDDDALQFWPNECKEVVLEYVKTSTVMVKKLLQALIGNLGVKLSDSRLDTLLGSKSVHMIFYPTCPNPELTIGVRKHSDKGTLTMLLQDDIGGLYVKKGKNLSSGDEEWIEVPPIHGALGINVGDMLQILSNGRYKSAEHVVQTTNTASRVSVPIFNAPLPVAIIGPFPELVASDGVARYRDISYKEYTNNINVEKPCGRKIALEFVSI
ncbi:unnamed protein product [Lactuca virosa]|uniref:feruloyl-CoA 6-hydroxylase n=1 Tax=Lactuca virosa TaxID=75947 RepID=A0AAU9P0G4_9ASTR|nr:unnamed protein product [Lactuca virosa]